MTRQCACCWAVRPEAELYRVAYRPPKSIKKDADTPAAMTGGYWLCRTACGTGNEGEADEILRGD